jgi:hypothetical protein
MDNPPFDILPFWWQDATTGIGEWLAARGRDADQSRVIYFVQKSPVDFTLEKCQVPSLKSLIPWSKKRFGSVHPQLVSWLASVRQQLESATAGPPTPPTDWARPADLGCKCEYCAELTAFLIDPANEVGRIAAREDRRQHLSPAVSARSRSCRARRGFSTSPATKHAGVDLGSVDDK